MKHIVLLLLAFAVCLAQEPNEAVMEEFYKNFVNKEIEYVKV